MDKVGGPACKRRPSRSFVSNNFAEIPAAERKKRCSLVPLFDILLAFFGVVWMHPVLPVAVLPLSHLSAFPPIPSSKAPFQSSGSYTRFFQ